MKQKKLFWLAVALALAVGLAGLGGRNGAKAEAAAWPVLREDSVIPSGKDAASTTAEDLANAVAFGSGILRREIGSIQFEASLSGAPAEAWDVSQKQDGKALAWAVKGENALYDLHIAGEGGVALPEDCAYLFSFYSNAKTIDFGHCVSTAQVKSMNAMFGGCQSLTALDVSDFDTKNVTDMGAMFAACASLTALDVSGWDTGSVVNMSEMFEGCAGLTTLNFSDAAAGQPPAFSQLFLSWSGLGAQEASGWNTASVADMSYMFYQCAGLTALDVSGWDTANVTNMTGMFSGCKRLSAIRASEKFVIPANAGDMFTGCPAGGLTRETAPLPTEIEPTLEPTLEPTPIPTPEPSPNPTPDLSAPENWPVLRGDALEAISRLNGLDSASFRTFIGSIQFEGTLANAPAGAWDVSQRQDGQVLAWALEGDRGRYALYVAGNGGVQLPPDCSSLFAGWTNLQSIDFGGCVSTAHVTNMSHMFDGCAKLPTVDLSDFDTAQVTDMSFMFANMTDASSFAAFLSGINQVTLDVSGLDTANVTNMRGMFANTWLQGTLDVSGWDTARVTDMTGMFQGCKQLTAILASEKFVIPAQAEDMFTGCPAGGLTLDTAPLPTEIEKTLEPTPEPSPTPGLSNPENWPTLQSDSIFTWDILLSMSHDDQQAYKQGGAPVLGGKVSRGEINRILFENSLDNAPDSAWDVTRKANRPPVNKVLAWVEDGTLHIAGKGGVQLPPDCEFLFAYYPNLIAIDFNGCVNTAKVTNMAEMFEGCPNLASLDVSGFDTSKVTDMYCMFYDCKSLTALDVSGFDTRHVTDMGGMFYDCESLPALNLSGFGTSRVTDMNRMFTGCKSLTALDVSHFDTRLVTDMEYMFANCGKLTALNLSGLDTSRVTDMCGMFSGCQSLTALDVSGLDTRRATDMESMFSGCTSLTTLDVSGLDTRSVTDMGNMFFNCGNLESLDVSGWDTSRVTKMSYMFYGCKSLTALDVSGFDTGCVTDMGSMFAWCESLPTLDLSGWDTGNVEDMSGMFQICQSLNTLDLTSFNTRKVTNMAYMFSVCSSLTTIKVSPHFVIPMSVNDMFSGCPVGGLTLETAPSQAATPMPPDAVNPPRTGPRPFRSGKVAHPAIGQCVPV